MLIWDHVQQTTIDVLALSRNELEAERPHSTAPQFSLRQRVHEVFDDFEELLPSGD